MSSAHDQHLSPEQIEGLVRERLDWRGLTRVLTHLALCEACRRSMVDRYPTHGPALLVRYLGTDHLPALPSGSDPDVGPVIAAGLDGITRARRELAEADRAWEGLKDLTPRQLALRLHHSESLQTLGMVVILLEESKGRWVDEPREAESLADLALDLLDRCRDYPESQLHDLRARAFAYRSNCRRLRGRLRAATRDMAQAREHLTHGSRDPLELAQILEHESSLLRDRGDYQEAAEALQKAADLHDTTGDHQAAMRMQMLGALVLRDAGSPEQALELLKTLASRFTPDAMGMANDFDLRYHKALLSMELERDDEATAHLGEIRRIANLRGLPWVARVDWLEAALLHRQGRLEEAEALYRGVQDVFRARSMVYESVVVILDLSLLYLEAGRPDGLRALAHDLAGRALSHELSQEALAALYVFRRAAFQSQVTPELIQETRHALHRPRSRRPLFPSPR